jgi:hypothetical protein
MPNATLVVTTFDILSSYFVWCDGVTSPAVTSRAITSQLLLPRLVYKPSSSVTYLEFL